MNTSYATAELTSQQYWAGQWARAEARGGFVYLDALAPFLPPDRDLSFLEIGCAPGGILRHICGQFGYEAHGVDYAADVVEITAYLQASGVRVGEITRADFTTWNPSRRYDVVASFGFVEHFIDAAAVASRHFGAVRPGGTVVIGMPHFARGQKALHWLFDRDNLRRHNTACMNRRFLRTLADQNRAELLFAGFVGGHFSYWAEEQRRSRLSRMLCMHTTKWLYRLARRAPGKSNPLFSPYLLGVYRAGD